MPGAYNGLPCKNLIRVNSANLHRIWSETMGRLEAFSRRVSEGRDVIAASEFARWVFFSGLIQLCKENSQDGFFKVDGALLQWTCDQLIERCNERFRTNNLEPSFRAEEFQSLHDKIDRMAGYLSRLSVAPAVVVNPLPRDGSNFDVISGGLDDSQGWGSAAAGARQRAAPPPAPYLDTDSVRVNGKVKVVNK